MIAQLMAQRMLAQRPTCDTDDKLFRRCIRFAANPKSTAAQLAELRATLAHTQRQIRMVMAASNGHELATLEYSLEVADLCEHALRIRFAALKEQEQSKVSRGFTMAGRARLVA